MTMREPPHKTCALECALLGRGELTIGIDA